MAIKSVKCRAEQSSSFGHSRPSPRTHMTIYDTQLHDITPHSSSAVHSSLQESCQTTALSRDYSPHYSVRRRFMGELYSAAVDKAVDIWYNTGVGVKETQQTRSKTK